jgi:hypothetical protein
MAVMVWRVLALLRAWHDLAVDDLFGVTERSVSPAVNG